MTGAAGCGSFIWRQNLAAARANPDSRDMTTDVFRTCLDGEINSFVNTAFNDDQSRFHEGSRTGLWSMGFNRVTAEAPVAEHKTALKLLLEGSGTPLADLSSHHAAIAGSLLWGTAFDAPDATNAPVSVTAPDMVGHSVDFRDGSTGGWSGYFASPGNPGTGGPDGAGYLSAFTPGDGTTGYFVAPVTLPGDRTGFGSLRITLRTGTGDYADPYACGRAIAFGNLRIKKVNIRRTFRLSRCVRIQVLMIFDPDATLQTQKRFP